METDAKQSIEPLVKVAIHDIFIGTTWGQEILENIFQKYKSYQAM